MKNRIIISKKAVNYSLMFGFLCAVFLSFAQFNVACDDLRTNVLRLHIIANSDSADDQALKLKIRDRILLESGNIFENVSDVDEAIIKAQNSIDDFCETANQVIAENGMEYKAQAYIGERYFETRVYDDFTLPAGKYKSLIITVGEGAGKNWWCVIFPEVCLPAAADSDLEDTVSAKSAQVAKCPEKYIIRFKAVEIYENIKNLIKR